MKVVVTYMMVSFDNIVLYRSIYKDDIGRFFYADCQIINGCCRRRDSISTYLGEFMHSDYSNWEITDKTVDPSGALK